MTYDFTALKANTDEADFKALGFTSATAFVEKNNAKQDTVKIPANTTAKLSIGATVYSKGEGNLILRYKTAGDFSSGVKAINYGGQSVGDSKSNRVAKAVGETEDGTISRYIELPLDNITGKFTLALDYATTNDKTIKWAVVDQDNKTLAVSAEDNSKTSKTWTTDTLTKGSATAVRLYLYRVGDASSGGANVTSITVAPAE